MSRATATANLSRATATANLSRVTATANLSRVTATANLSKVTATANLSKVTATANLFLSVSIIVQRTIFLNFICGGNIFQPLDTDINDIGQLQLSLNLNVRRAYLCRIFFFINLTRLFYLCIARVKHIVVVPHFHWRLTSVKTSVTTLDFSVHFILFSNFVLKITALHILIESLVRGDYFFIHILSIYIP